MTWALFEMAIFTANLVACSLYTKAKRYDLAVFFGGMTLLVLNSL